uniref:Uncharacterized protein n=1 Tax=Mus musculus TaxID=10090 RepID=Q8C346_MOUSE|nr:unnamed protein product [Mus musculus]
MWPTERRAPAWPLSPHARKGDHAQKRRRISIVTLLEDAWWDNVEGFLPGFRAGCCSAGTTNTPPCPDLFLSIWSWRSNSGLHTFEVTSLPQLPPAFSKGHLP